jgi:predicted phosphodiesterase
VLSGTVPPAGQFQQPDGGGRIPVDAAWLASQGVDIPPEGLRWIGATIEQGADGRRHWVRVVPTTVTGPDWPVVQPAAPVTVRCQVPTPRTPDGWERAFIFPDTQIGYRQLRDPEGGTYLDPFHDEQAIAAAVNVMVAAEPDRVIFLGDSLDFPGQSKYIQDPSWALTTQDAIDRFYRLLATVRALLPAARIEVLEGNHDLRLPRSIQVNAAASFRLQQAAKPASWPVLTVPHLCRFDELDVSYFEGYPAARLWVNERLCCIHGHKVRSGGSTAAAVIDDERVSTIFGHVHRIELQHKTRHTWAGGRQSLAATPGTLCRIDGAVPSVKGGVDALGRPLTSYEDWQQGCAVVTYKPGDGPFSLELVPIHEGRAIFRGQVIDAAVPVRHLRAVA